MLNYIWAGLIVASLVFAVAHDVHDAATDRYRNGRALPVALAFPEGFRQAARRQPVQIRLDSAAYSRFYGAGLPAPAATFEGYIIRSQEGIQLRFAAGAALPEPLATIKTASESRDDELQGRLAVLRLTPDGARAAVTFAPVQLVRVRAITAAAFDFAETAATLALSLVGVLALFLGLLAIAEASGIVHALVRFTQPIFRPLFPEIPDGHPALGLIALNLTANVLGLGNAATPLGIKAMEELQKLNPTEDTATNSMVMLLALNTASVQLVPPTLLVAVMGMQVNELIMPIILVTVASAGVAITAARLLSRLRRYRLSDPERLRAGAAPDPAP